MGDKHLSQKGLPRRSLNLVSVSDSPERDDSSLKWSRERPLVELICGINFRLIPHLTGPTIGLFWNQLEREFPKCRTMPRLHQSNIVIGPLPEPRVWLLDQDEGRILQIQNDTLLLNWRRSEKNDQYPRFSRILEDYRRYFGRLESFLSERGLGQIAPTGVQMSYINQVLYPEEVSKAVFLSEIFPDIAWRGKSKKYLPEPGNLDLSTSFHLPEDLGRLTFNITSPVKPIAWLSKDGQALRFDISVTASAVGEVSSDELFAWFGKANEAINGAFQDLVHASG